MTFEMTDHVPGLNDDRVAALAEEAEMGYDVRPHDGEPNPHSQRVRLIPEDLMDAVEARAKQDGQSTEAVLREALVAYLRTA